LADSGKGIHVGCIVTGHYFDEPMLVETITSADDSSLILGLVGTKSERFRKVTLHLSEIEKLAILDYGFTYDGDSRLLKIGLQAYALGIAWEFDPYFGLSISRVDPLPHQLEAIYDYLLKLARVRFLLADDAGAGKTIMAGLLIRELQLRGLAEKILIVCPSNLSFQWQRELKEKFTETFQIIKGWDIREQFGSNQWMERKKVITSLDLAKRDDILPGLRQVHWDLVIVDEAHRMSATDETHKSLRYKLGELLRDTSDHILLMTATPHKGDPENFSLFLQLLDTDAFADVKSIQEAMTRRRAPFYLRRTKEAMVYFPKLKDDGKWVAEKIFTRRIPRTADFQMDGPEKELYDQITRFVKRQSHKAALAGDDKRARAVGFLMALYQRRLASSTYAMRNSLQKRAKRLEDALEKAYELARLAPPDLPDMEEFEEMEDSKREEFEELLDAVTLASNSEQIQEEIKELKQLAMQAEDIEKATVEAKLSKLKTLLQTEGFFSDASKRLLIFTEYKDTLEYLVAKLREWNFSVGYIHGQMKPGSREEPGTRLHAEQQFKEGAIQVLVATEAAGEGINLQCCNILFNYDIPWNPNRLEQRMGRIHRYGQTKDCLIFNFVATNTIEGKVLNKLLEKLQEIRDALEDDAVFNVVGEILPSAHVERVLRDYYAGKLGDDDLEERLLENVDEGRFRAICQNALEGLAAKKLNLEMLIERRAKAQEHRVVPETIARFIREAAEFVPLKLKVVESKPHTFEPAKTPLSLHKYERDPDWKFAQLASKYQLCSADRETAEKEKLEWVTPGHPLFEAIRRCACEKSAESMRKGACFYSIDNEKPSRIDFYRARVVDGLGDTIHERLFAVELSEDAEPCLREPNTLGNMSPATTPEILPPIAAVPENMAWLNKYVLQQFLAETRFERLAEIERVEDHIELSLTELIQRADEEIGRANEEKENNIQGAEGRLAQTEARHSELMARRARRRQEIERQKGMALQAVERVASVLVLPHPDRNAKELTNIRQNRETEEIAMRVVMEFERSQGRVVEDVHLKNLGYDITSLDLKTGELRLIEIKGLGDATGTILLTPNERRVAEDRKECYWLYIVTNCNGEPVLQTPVQNPGKHPWHEVRKVQHYYLEVDAMTKPMKIREE